MIMGSLDSIWKILENNDLKKPKKLSNQDDLASFCALAITEPARISIIANMINTGFFI
jgi:hypothetical protein